MSYYTLPSFNINNIHINKQEHFNISNSLVQYVTQCYNNLIENNYKEFGLKFVYIYPLLNRKLKQTIDIFFYSIIEINTICNLIYDNTTILLIDDNATELKENLINYTNIFNSFNTYLYKNELIDDFKYSLIFKNSIIENIDDFIEILNLIKNHQDDNGDIVIKIKNTNEHLYINIIYILSIIYNKITILKPTSGNIFTFERYIVCKKYNKNLNLDNFVKDIQSKQSISISNIPLFFLNKLDECNTIMGQQQLDCILFMHQCNYNKDKYDKIENLYKKINHKVLTWLDTNNINKINNNKRTYSIDSTDEDIYTNEEHQNMEEIICSIIHQLEK
jgi:hypothetical protein